MSAEGNKIVSSGLTPLLFAHFSLSCCPGAISRTKKSLFYCLFTRLSLANFLFFFFNGISWFFLSFGFVIVIRRSKKNEILELIEVVAVQIPGHLQVPKSPRSNTGMGLLHPGVLPTV